MIDSFKGEYEFLSNFFPYPPITYKGIVFPTLENAFQSAKNSNLMWRHSLVDMTPGEAKRAGKAITLRGDWDLVKFEIMRDLLRQKFFNPVMRRLIISTGGEYIVEGNTWHDNIWGVCRCAAKCPKWNGKSPRNALGNLLMDIKGEIVR